MSESDILKKTAANHHGKQHGIPVPDVHSKDGIPHIPQTEHEGNEHRHGSEENRPKKRRIPMKRLAQALTVFAISLIFILNIAVANIEAATIRRNVINDDIQSNINDVGIQSIANDATIGIGTIKSGIQAKIIYGGIGVIRKNIPV